MTEDNSSRKNIIIPLGKAVPEELRSAISRLKGRAFPDLSRATNIKEIDLEDIYPFAAEIRHKEISEAEEKERARKEAGKAEELKGNIGSYIKGKGIYIGSHEFKNDDGESLGEYDLYAAPEDLKVPGDKNNDRKDGRLLLKYYDAVDYVAELRDYFNHNGGSYANDSCLKDAIKEGSYKGEWFIPTKEILNEHLYFNHSKGDLKGSFNTETGTSDGSVWYWSCSNHRLNTSNFMTESIKDGSLDWFEAVNDKLSVRCVRAEPKAKL
jgi:hypothetical protein